MERTPSTLRGGFFMPNNTRHESVREPLLPVVVLTGGPAAGKTSIVSAIRDEHGSSIEVIPEAAQMLIAGGFPMPGEALGWTQAWQYDFQDALQPLQLSLERHHRRQAIATGKKLLLCDRGLLDQAAYLPGGTDEFLERYKMNREEVFARYQRVLHLGTIATNQQDYERVNALQARVEQGPQQIQQADERTRQAWAEHPGVTVIPATDNIEDKVQQVLGILHATMTT